MTAPPEAHGYVLLDRRHAAAGRLDAPVAALAADGWRKRVDLDGVEVWLGPRSRLSAVQVHRRHLLIGRWFGEAPLSALVGASRSAAGLAAEVLGAGWGVYVLAWIDDHGRLALLRDPSGALDCVWWRRGGAIIACSEPPRALDPALPEGAAIDWEALARLTVDISGVSDAVLIKGLNTVSPGTLVQPQGDPVERPLWTPALWVDRPWDDDPRALARVVDRATRALTSGRTRLIGELSGGLDSALTAAALQAAGRSRQTVFVNYYGEDAEGDERRYARAIAEGLGLTTQFVSKTLAPLGATQILPLGQALRPAVNGLDWAYDADMAARAAEAGAGAIVTGQGGDAVLQHDADPNIAVDRYRRMGLRGLGPGYLTAMAQWTRRPATGLLARAVSWRPPAEAGPATGHRWTRDAGLPPAKAAQISHLANAQAFWGDCLRARQADLIQPLLAQPVVEHCLALPVDRLTLGARDRGLARAAFAGRVPDLVLDRRGKGDLTGFYARAVAASLPFLRPFLLEGRLADHRLIDPAALDRTLTLAALIQSPGANRPLILAVLEAWLRAWEGRLAGRR